ncbi:MAG: 2-oxoglutarate and iron-dependent oxygenase domain-containing protein, partial [Pseudomonadota bacterium]
MATPRDADSEEGEEVGEFSEVPEIDVSALTRGGDTCALAQRFVAVYRDTGFAYITGHGVDPALRAAVFDASRRFHALPLEDKLALSLDANHRGYIAINTSTDVTSDLAEVTKPNQSASFMLMREDATADPAVYLSGPNRWPALDGFRVACEAYVAAMTALSRRLLALAYEGLGVTDAAALRAFDTPTTWLRLLHYPPQPHQAPDDLYGSAPHRDFGCLTLLAQDDVGGLQVQTPAGAWVDAPPVPDAF